MKQGVEPFPLLLPKLVEETKFHFVPATRSRTATLLRLHPNYQSLNGLY